MISRECLQVYLSVLPIITGVCVATLTEVSFDITGLVSALIATLGFSSLNIFTKKVSQMSVPSYLLLVLSYLQLVLSYLLLVLSYVRGCSLTLSCPKYVL